jgi:CheY-like chemotaxis protein
MADRLLLVEDDDTLRESLRETLEEYGFSVDEAEHGKAALEYLRSHPSPCLVLLDLMMPVMNGWEFMAALQCEPGISMPRVVVTSAVADSAPKGVIAAIKKPFDIDGLVTMLKRLCPDAIDNPA